MKSNWMSPADVSADVGNTNTSNGYGYLVFLLVNGK